MKHLFLCLILSVPSFGAIAFEHAQTCLGVSAPSLSCTTSIAVAQGDAVVFLGSGAFNYIVSSGCGLNFQPPPGYPNSPGASTWINLQVALNAPATAASCSVTMTRASGTDLGNQFLVLTYSGVGAVGQSYNRFGGTTVGNAVCPSGLSGGSVSGLTPTSAGNYVVSAWKINAGSAAVGSTTLTAASPATPRTTVAGGQWIYSAGDTVVTTPGAVMIPRAAITTGSSNNLPCSGSDVELVASTAVAVRTARISDATQTVMLTNPSGNDYVLPGTLTSTWCAYVMPEQDSTITPQAGVNLNGQTGAMNLPAWQMSRVCHGPASGASASALTHRGSSGRTLVPIVAVGNFYSCVVTSTTQCQIQNIAVGPNQTVVALTKWSGAADSTIDDTCNHQFAQNSNPTPRISVGLPNGQSGPCTLTLRKVDNSGGVNLSMIVQIYSGVGSVDTTSSAPATGWGPSPGTPPTAVCYYSNPNLTTVAGITAADGELILTTFQFTGAGALTGADGTTPAVPGALAPYTLRASSVPFTTGPVGLVELPGPVTNGKPGISATNVGSGTFNCTRGYVILRPATITETVGYWASPPLIGVSGITVEGTPDGILISYTPTRDASGVSTLTGAALAAERCVERTQKNVPGVKPNDRIVVKPVKSTKVSVSGVAKRNEVDFRVCNHSQRSIQFDAFRVNWYAEPYTHTAHH